MQPPMKTGRQVNMSYLDIWIGDFDDPDFSWDGENWAIGNIPTRKSPLFSSSDAFFKLINDIESGKLVGKQTDWGGFTAKATKSQIKEFFKEFYTNDETEKGRGTTIDPLTDNFMVFVESLDDNKIYALVAAET